VLDDAIAFLHSTAGFFTSFVGSGLIAFLLSYPSGECLTTTGCTNFIGLPALSSGEAAIAATLVGFLIAGLVYAIAGALQERANRDG
jgi:hypothetical protein